MLLIGLSARVPLVLVFRPVAQPGRSSSLFADRRLLPLLHRCPASAGAAARRGLARREIWVARARVAAMSGAEPCLLLVCLPCRGRTVGAGLVLRGPTRFAARSWLRLRTVLRLFRGCAPLSRRAQSGPRGRARACRGGCDSSASGCRVRPRSGVLCCCVLVSRPGAL